MITVMKFYATWCKPCQMLSKVLESNKEITEIDISAQPEVAAKYHVRKVPTLVFFKDNVEVHRTTGLITKHEYDVILTELNDSKELNLPVVDAEIVKPETKE